MKNRTILEVFGALVELNGTKLPPLCALRIGRNLNSVRAVVDVIEATRLKLVTDYHVGEAHQQDPEYPERLRAFESAYKQILEDESAWTPPITLSATHAEECQEFAYAAQLYAAGILVD